MLLRLCKISQIFIYNKYIFNLMQKVCFNPLFLRIFQALTKVINRHKIHTQKLRNSINNLHFFMQNNDHFFTPFLADFSLNFSLSLFRFFDSFTLILMAYFIHDLIQFSHKNHPLKSSTQATISRSIYKCIVSY